MPRPIVRFAIGAGAAILAAAMLLAISIGPTAGMAVTMLHRAEGGLFDFPPLPTDLGSQNERSVVYARDGSVLAVLHVENRQSVPLSQVPQHVQDAVLATEDADFYTHQGVNWRAVLRAALGNLRAGEVTSGASTITQQVVKNFVTGGEVTLRRKVREAAYAVELEKRMDKRAILELYLNDAYFANGVYGIATAAEYYFGKDVSELDVAEAALLAGMIRAPERNDPRDYPARARARRDIVLGQMAEEGYIDAEQARRLQAAPMALDIHPLEEARNPFFVDYVRHLLKQSEALGPDVQARDRAVLRGGLAIHTTLDPRLQDIAQQVITEVLRRDGDPLAALSTIDPKTGEILALGFGPKPYGKGPGQTEVNPAVPGLGSSGRQAGSAFKVFQLVAALEEGISPGYSFNAGSKYDWKPPRCDRHTVGNYADASQGVLDMAAATAVSSNTYFARLVDLTGPEKLAEVATRMGITTQVDPFCATVLGTEEVFPLDMASAFGVLANSGVRCPPFAISRIDDREGRTILRNEPRCERVVDKGLAARATSLLRGPIENGTASHNGRIGRPAAGKTGTTNDYRNAWFTGYIPQLSTAVWVGHEQNVPMLGHPACPRGVTGGCLPTLIWSRFMKRAIDTLNLPVKAFPAAPAIPTVPVPSVVGTTEVAARQKLEDAGFTVMSETVTDHRKAGTVVKQDPPGDSRAPKGGLVSISVSDGTGVMPLVPALVGLTEEEARKKLAELDISAQVQTAPVEDHDDVGKVLSQTPPAGGDATAVKTVLLTVGRERRPGDPSPTPTGTVSPSASASPSPTATGTVSPSPEPSDDEEPSPTPRPRRTRRPRPTPTGDG